MIELIRRNGWNVVGIAVGILIGVSLVPGVFASVPSDTRWHSNLRASFLFTNTGTNNTSTYPAVSGIGEAQRSRAWLGRARGNVQRHVGRWMEDHRLDLTFGKTDGRVSDDLIDLWSLFRWEAWEQSSAHYYGSARARSNFADFNRPTRGDFSSGLGAFWLQSDRWGTLESLVGLRWNRRWNSPIPEETEWQTYYELIMDYDVTIREGVSYSSELETFTLVEEPQQYTVRWDGRLNVDLTTGIHLEYVYTTYYEREQREVAVRTLTALSMVYEWGN